jgi:acetylornithine deacetylase/succinyl-diaminopimelate desuccinylase-like protein
MTDPHLNDLLEFLRFPSVSTQSVHASDMVACATWIREKFLKIGLEAKICETGGHPAVIAHTVHDPAKRTVLIYGHYDVQPPEPLEEWKSPPFEPEIRDGRIFARGATDNKGQILAHILGMGEILARGETPPVNVTFLVEGEEETGSEHLEAFLESHRAELACDVIVISDTGMAAHAHPTLTYALRGIAALECVLTGPSQDLHSGVFGGAVTNPATALARLVATLHDADGRVAIPGFYDAVQPLADWERQAADALPITEEQLRQLTGVPALAGEPGYSSIERIGARPTVEVNGLGGGYQGEGTKTVLPREAFAKLTMRLVPQQDPATILQLVGDHLKAHCPDTVRIQITGGHCGEAYFMDPNHPDGLAARRALKEVFGCEPSLMREGGSIPIVTTFKNILGADSLLLALASPDCCAHSPNENFPIENFHTGIRLHQAVLRELGKAQELPL